MTEIKQNTASSELMPVRDAQTLLLYLLQQFENVCHTASIKWYASGGTCLGAVRHKGFIPWDDDIDIDMPREYCDAFLQTCARLLPENVVLRTRETDPYYYQEFIKLCYKDDVLGYSELSLDIFLYDETNPKRKLFRAVQNFLVRGLYFLKEYKVGKDGKGPAYVPDNFMKHCLVRLMSGLSYETIDRTLKKVMSAEKRDSGYWVDWGAAHSYQEATFEKKQMGTPKLLPFENTVVCVPENTDYFLRRLYGDNYMELPPEEKRKQHYCHVISNSSLDIEKIRAEVNDPAKWSYMTNG